MSQMKIEDVAKKPVLVNGIRQNCYLLDRRVGVDSVRPLVETKKYFDLEEKQLPNGYAQELVEKDYPINSDSVSSYIESSDYRNDPLQAIANAPKRVNLGDISEVQRFMNENPVEATRQYADILSKVSQYFKEVAEKQSQQKTASSRNSAPVSATANVNAEVNK